MQRYEAAVTQFAHLQALQMIHRSRSVRKMPWAAGEENCVALPYFGNKIHYLCSKYKNLSFACAKHLIFRHGSDGASPLPEEGDLGEG